MNNKLNQVSRRSVIMGSLMAGAPMLIGWAAHADGVPATVSTTAPTTGPAAKKQQRYKIAVVDWMLLKRQKPRAISLAKECGMDGVEVDMGGLGNALALKNNLKEEIKRAEYFTEMQKSDIEISSLALSAFYGKSYAAHESAANITAEWIETMQLMKVKYGSLPLLGDGDVKDKPDVWKKTVALLKQAAPAAEKAGVVMGLEAGLDADGHKKFLDDVGSTSVKVYYNLGRMEQLGYDVYKELKELGKDRISQIRCKESTKDGEKWLSEGSIDFKKIKAILDEMGWSGWLIVERSRQKGKSVVENYSENARFLKSVFQGK